MIVETIQIRNRIGLHARPSCLIASEAGKFQSDIKIQYRDKIVDARGTIGILALGVVAGEEIRLTISGKDEKKAYESLSGVFAEINCT